MKPYLIAGTVITAVLLQACNATPTTRPPVSGGTVRTPPAQPDTNRSAEDQQYAVLLNGLSQRDPHAEAKQAIESGQPYLMGYYSGRAGLKLPGLTTEQQQSQRCPLKTIDGLGDVIYGENHLKYRIAMRNFAKSFNHRMLDVCL